MKIRYLRCAKCGKTYLRKEPRYRCDCGESIELIYDYGQIAGRLSWELLRSRPFDHWRYREFYPDLPAGSIISMGEGGTPLIRSRHLAPGGGELLFKLENANPTGSFKDRGSAVEISHAYQYFSEQGRRSREIVCASTGNMGASVAAYSARGGISCTIYVPKCTPKIKLLQMLAHGARIIPVDGDYTLAMQTARREYEAHGKYLAGDYPYRSEGEKSAGLEVIDQVNGELDYLACPIGNGTLVHGIWKGLKELQIAGLLRRLPKIIGVQAAGCNTVVKAFEEGRDDIVPVMPRTLMDAVACGDPLDGTWALRALRASEGWATTVSDAEGASARDLLAKKDGIFAELSGALSLAGLLKAREAGMIEKDARVVALVTGHGLKEPETFEEEMQNIKAMETCRFGR